MGEGTSPPTYLNYLAIKVSKLPRWILSTEVVDELLLHKCTFPLLESNFMKHTRVCVWARAHTHTHTHTHQETHIYPSNHQTLSRRKIEGWNFLYIMKFFKNVASNISISEESPNGFISCKKEQFMNHCFHAKVFHSFKSGAINCTGWFFLKYQNLILA